MTKKVKRSLPKRKKIDTSVNTNGRKEWLRVGAKNGRLRDSIIAGERLNDLVNNVAQRLLKNQFPKMKGLCSTLLQNKKNELCLNNPWCKLYIHVETTGLWRHL